MLFNLSEHFYEEDAVSKLAELGLGVEKRIVNSALANNRRINTAMHKILQTWKVSTENEYVAFTAIHAALIKVKMSFLLKELKE